MSVIIIALVIGAASLREVERTTLANQQGRLAAVTNALANLSANHLNDAHQVLIKIAEDTAARIGDERRDVQALQQRLRPYAILFPEISYLNAQGREETKVVLGEMVTELRDLSKTPLFQRVLANPHNIEVSEPYWSDTLNMAVVELACWQCGAINDSKFVIRATLSLKIFSDAIGDIDLGQEGFYVLLDDTGNILGTSLREHLAKSISSVGQTDPSLSKILGSRKSVEFGRYLFMDCDCMVMDSMAHVTEELKAVVGIPFDQYQSPMTSLKEAFYLTCALTGGLALLLSVVISHRITAPITLLTRTASNIARDGALERQVE